LVVGSSKIGVSMDRYELGARLTEIRGIRELSIEEAASLAGVSTTRLLSIEAGDNCIRFSTLLGIIRAWQITSEELFS
jgi:hypothetical protein